MMMMMMMMIDDDDCDDDDDNYDDDDDVDNDCDVMIAHVLCRCTQMCFTILYRELYHADCFQGSTTPLWLVKLLIHPGHFKVAIKLLGRFPKNGCST